MATTVNYFNRKVDVALFGEKTNDTPVNIGLRPTSLAITGKLKASQNYLRAFFSTLGERKERPLFGSLFLFDITSGNLNFSIQINQIFSSHNALVLKSLSEMYDDSVPDDERVRSVTLLNYSIQPGRMVILNIELVTAAGEDHIFYLPVKWSKN